MASLLRLPVMQQPHPGLFKLKDIWRTTATKSSSTRTLMQTRLEGTRKISCMALATCGKQPGSALAAEMSRGTAWGWGPQALP